MPVKESNRERLAFRKEPLKIKGISSRSLISLIFSAISKAISSPSIAQGPARRKKFVESL
jgi:hypothetical protein